MRTGLGVAMALCLATVAGAQETRVSGEGAGETAVTAVEIEKLIKDLGDDQYAVREAASERLHKIGLPAVRALREAVKSPDFEVKSRAEWLLNAIFRIPPELRAERRAAIQKAFGAADYAAAIPIARRLTAYENAESVDWLWYGHACQLAGRWAEAVRAYRKAVECVDADIRKGVKERPEGNRAPAVGMRPGVVVAVGPVAPPGPIPLDPHERKELLNQRSTLMLWIARMQSVELKDAKAAAKTLTETLDYLEASKTKVDYVWLEIAEAYPRMLHRAGDVPGAVAAWKRCIATLRRRDADPYNRRLVDVELLYRGLCSLPAGAPRPDVPWIVSFGDDEPAMRLDCDDAETRARSYLPGIYDHYALAPPRGREFAAIEYACDIEQFQLRHGGQFSCFVMAHDPPDRPLKLGSIGWPAETTGRRVVRKAFAIPPGAGLVHIRVCRPKEFTVHSVSAKATFRPVTKDPAPIQADAWMQTELHPADGRLTWGPKTMRTATAHTGVRPRRQRLRFSAPGRSETIEMPFEVKPGRRYGLFFNLDSPFRRRQSDLELTVRQPADKPALSIQRLGKDRYIAIWCGGNRKLLAARSRDLLHWTEPKRLPFNSVFANIEPATFRAPDGTIYLAFFSNRLCLQTMSSAGYHLWLTRTGDGQSWAPIRRIEIGRLGGWPLSSPAMLVGPKGKQWMFWRDKAGSAETLDAVSELTPIDVQDQEVNGRRVELCNVHVIVDDRKQFHMVFDDFGRAVCHIGSADGRSWTRPRVIVKRRGTSSGPTHPQLILAGGEALLLHEGAYLRRVDLKADPISAGDGIKLANHVAPLAGARLFRQADEVVLVAGTQTTWLLRAKRKDLLGALTNQ